MSVLLNRVSREYVKMDEGNTLLTSRLCLKFLFIGITLFKLLSVILSCHAHGGVVHSRSSMGQNYNCFVVFTISFRH